MRRVSCNSSNLCASHDTAVLLLLLLIAPTKTLALHLGLASSTLKFLKTFLRFGKFVRFNSLATAHIYI